MDFSACSAIRLLPPLMQFEELASGVRHATDLGNALPEASFISAIIVADQFTAPVTQEGPGVCPAASFGKVVNDSLQILEGAGSIGPQICARGLLAAWLQHLHGRLAAFCAAGCPPRLINSCSMAAMSASTASSSNNPCSPPSCSLFLPKR